MLDELFAGDHTFAAEVISIPLQNPKIETRSHLIGEAREAGLKEIVPTLVSLLDDSDKGVRASSVAALGDFGDRRAIGPLQRLLEREKDPYAQHGIRLSLAKLGRPYVGYFPKIPNEFQPDRRAPQYQGRHGLSEKFFSDTVKNSLEWRQEHVKPAEKRPLPGPDRQR